jgi:predicted dehydrogenase
MGQGTNRRDFIKQGGLYAGALWVVGSGSNVLGARANEKLNVAFIGVGGKGASDISGVAGEKAKRDPQTRKVVSKTFDGENVAFLCDIDDSQIDARLKDFPKAQRYNDYRKLFDEQAKSMDAVVVSTPDHHHAAATAAALRLGKHVYCQKPLTHSIHEARVLAELAAKAKVATQMGNQGHSNEATRKVVEVVRTGVIGPIKEVHAWTNRPIWPQGIERPQGEDPIPSNVHWDLWVGPAPMRPYKKETYHPFKWRGFWDFGTGALGDMACHVLDTAYWALDLKNPTSVEAKCDGHSTDTAPKQSVIRYEFPERNGLPPVTFTWYDGIDFPKTDVKSFPPYALIPDGKFNTRVKSSSLLIGEKGVIYIPHEYGGEYMILPVEKFADFKTPKPTLPRSNAGGHYADWIEGCKNPDHIPCSNFAYATGLTETVLIGNLALRYNKKIEWDAANARATNCSEAEEIIRPAYRNGWQL